MTSTTARAYFQSLALFLSFWALTRIIELADMDQGNLRAWASGLLLLVAFGAWKFAQPQLKLKPEPMKDQQSSQAAKIEAAVFGVVLTVLVAYQGFQLKEAISSPHLNDIATTTISAAMAIKAGDNPYTLPIDSHPDIDPEGRFVGYKYLPSMPLIYMAAAVPPYDSPLLATNGLLYALAAFLVFAVARKQAGLRAGLVALAFFLSIPMVPNEVFGWGVTDLSAVVPLLGAYLLGLAAPFWCGLLIGTSLSTKLLPALVLVPALWQPLQARAPQNMRLLLGFLIGLAPTFYFLIVSPVPLLQNTIFFSFSRSGDTTSWLPWAPLWIKSSAKYFAVLVAGALSLAAIVRRPSSDRRLLAVIGLIFCPLLLGPMNHRNYQIWWVPFVAIAVGHLVTAYWAMPEPEASNSLH